MSVRPEVAWFAEQMELQLKANDHKGGWLNLTVGYFFRRLDEELSELYDVTAPLAENGTLGQLDDEAVAKIIHEAADVANFALMVADVARQRYATRTIPSSPQARYRQAAPGADE